MRMDNKAKFALKLIMWFILIGLAGLATASIVGCKKADGAIDEWAKRNVKSWTVECPALTEKGKDLKFKSDRCKSYKSAMMYFDDSRTNRPCFCSKEK